MKHCADTAVSLSHVKKKSKNIDGNPTCRTVAYLPFSNMKKATFENNEHVLYLPCLVRDLIQCLKNFDFI